MAASILQRARVVAEKGFVGVGVGFGVGTGTGTGTGVGVGAGDVASLFARLSQPAKDPDKERGRSGNEAN